jgi:alpha-beta hydrolase superfamily lysophospholipase
MMRVEKYCLKRSESVELYGKLTIPDGAMNALVIMVHGIGEHGGCYDEWAEKFALQSIGFLAFDLRGHGHSPGVRGHATARLIRDDLRMIIKNVQTKFPSVPIVLFGPSMGGNIVLNYIIGKDVEVQGIIASSPWLKLVHPPSSLLVWLAKWISYIVPWLTVSTGIRADQLSHEGVSAKSTKTDTLLHKKISIKLFTDLWKNSKMILRNKHKLNIPILLMHGTDDPLTSYQASKSFAQNTVGHVTFKKWREMRHDLLNDAGNEVVFQYVMKWLSKQIINNGTVQNNSKLYRIA